ncbi:MAG: hypothetical protein KGL39_18730 [Patescibacteria group bacterium]|nr:hypothetical protein [Patescibacteria group bacterium]
MPYTMKKLPSGKVEVTSPHGVKSHGSTPANAKKQVNLLRAVDHGWHPSNRNALAHKLCAALLALATWWAAPAFATPTTTTTLQSAVTANGDGTILNVSTYEYVYVRVTIAGTAATATFQLDNGSGVYKPMQCRNVSTEIDVSSTDVSGKFLCTTPSSLNAKLKVPISRCSSCTVTVDAIGNTNNIPGIAPVSIWADNGGGGGGGSPSAGASLAVQTADGGGGFLDSGLNASGGTLLFSGTGIGDKISAFDPSTFSGDGGTHYGPKFNWTIQTYAGANSPASTNNNTVNNWGWNVTAISTVESAAEINGNVYIGMEKEYWLLPGKTNKARWEYYLRSIDTAGTLHHPFELTGAYDGSDGYLSMSVDEMAFQKYDGTTQVLKYVATTTPWEEFHFGRTAGEPMIMRQLRNGCPWITQRNAGDSAYYALGCINSKNENSLGSDTNTNTVVHGILNALSDYPNSAMAIVKNSATASKQILTLDSSSVTGQTYALYTNFSSTSGIVMLQNNQSNNAGAHSSIELAAHPSGGDPFILFDDGSVFWALGKDRSDSNAFVLSQNSTLGTTNRLRMSTNGGFAFNSFTFSNIATVLATNGEMAYCSDCTIANPCAGSGTGAIAKRLNGVNVCN